MSKKIIVVTGGAGKLGKIFCQAICDNGWVPVVADNDFDQAKLFSNELENRGAECIPMHINIADPISVNELIRMVDKIYGRVDAVVNNAYPRNANYGRRLEDVEYIDFCENLNMHLGGYFLVAQQFARYFSNQGSGNIINIASIYGVMAPRFEIYGATNMTMPVEYAAIKSAVIHLTRYFANYYKKNGIRVNSISPGGIIDGQPETFIRNYSREAGSKGLLDQVDVAGSLVYLLSDASRYVTGQNIIVDDGFSL